jgi:hypothetical protein
MADIHIGKISEAASGKGKAQLFYHIPIDAPVSGVVPTPESAISANLQQAELDALAAGSLVEVRRTVAILASQTQAEIAAAVKADWQNARAEYNNRYSFVYKLYGVTLNVTA